MYIELDELKQILIIDKKIINWFSVESVDDNNCKIELSDGEIFPIITSIEDMYDLIKNELNTLYALPSKKEIFNKFYVINITNLYHITDENVIFKNCKLPNTYENASVLIDSYELPFKYLFKHLS